MQLGIWPAEYALGEKLRAAMSVGSSEGSIRDMLRNYVVYNYQSDMASFQKKAEEFVKLLGGNAATSGTNGANNTLFAPIDRSKENTDRMHAITLSMGADTGKHSAAASAYNPAIVPIYALKNKNGTFVLPSGGSTTDRDKARVYTDRAEVESHCLSTQEIVEV